MIYRRYTIDLIFRGGWMKKLLTWIKNRIWIVFSILGTLVVSYGIAYFTFVLDMSIDDPIKWGEILSDGTTFASRLSVPVVLAIWSHSKSISDKTELKRKEDKEYIQTYVEKHLEPLTSNKFNLKKEDKNEENLKKILGEFNVWLSYLRYNMQHLSYSYMVEYFTLLYMLIDEVKKYNNLSVEELESFYVGISAHIYIVPSLLLLDEKKYQEEVPQTMEVLIDDEGNIRDITLKVLKAFPQYHEYAENYIKKTQEQEQKKVNTHTNTVHKTVEKEIAQLDKEIEETN